MTSDRLQTLKSLVPTLPHTVTNVRINFNQRIKLAIVKAEMLSLPYRRRSVLGALYPEHE